MLTGRYPRNHQLIMNGMALPESVPVLTTYLAGAGYRTHSVGKQHLQPLLAPAHCGMPDSRAFWRRPGSENWRGPYYGYQTAELLLGESDTAHLAGHYAQWLNQYHPESLQLLQPSSAAQPPPADLDEIWRSSMPAEHHYNTWITDHAVQFLEQQNDDDQSFFLFVSYPDPHHPFDPPAKYADRYDPNDMPLPRVDPHELCRMPPYYRELYPKGQGFRELYWAGRMDMEAGSMITTEDISDESMRRAIAYTYAMIEMIDDGVGRILSSLEQRGDAENTWVIFTSDHGELLGDHGLLHKGPPPYRQLTEVPLLMRGPGIAEGEIVNALTSHIDLAPTILELADVQADDANFDGVSLAALLSGEVNNPRSYNFGEYHPSARMDLYNQTVITDTWRLTLYPHHREWGELFDLAHDPSERNNIFADASAGRVRQALGTILATAFPPQPTVENEWLCKW